MKGRGDRDISSMKNTSVQKSVQKRNDTLLSRICSVYVFFMGTIFMVAIPATGYTVIAEWKYRLFLWCSAGFVLLLLLAWAETRLIALGEAQGSAVRKPGLFALFLLAYLFFTALSGVLSEYTGTFWGNDRHEGIATIGLYVLVTLLLARFLRPRKWMLVAFGIAVSLFCILGIVQLTGANPFSLYPNEYDFYDAGVYYAGEYWSTIGNTNLCAALLSLASGAFVAALACAKRRWEWLALLPLCLCVFCILELDSEAGMVALLGGLLLLVPFLTSSGEKLKNLSMTYGALAVTAAISCAVSFSEQGVAWGFPTGSAALCLGGAVLICVGVLAGRWKRLQNASCKVLRRCTLGAVAVVLVGGFLFLYLYDGFPEGFLSQAHELLHGNWDDSFGSGRLYIWRVVWELVREAPLLGGGPDTLGLRGLEGFSRYNEVLDMTVTSSIDAAHNEYLNILVNQGVFALVAYLAALAVSLVRWWRHPEDETAAVAGGAVLFYLIQALFGISMCLTAVYLWMALAVLNIKSHHREEEKL